MSKDTSVDKQDLCVYYSFDKLLDHALSNWTKSLQILGKQSFFLLFPEKKSCSDYNILSFITRNVEIKKEDFILSEKQHSLIEAQKKYTCIMCFVEPDYCYKYFGWQETKNLIPNKKVKLFDGLPTDKVPVAIEENTKEVEIKTIPMQIDLPQVKSIITTSFVGTTRQKLMFLYDQRPKSNNISIEVCMKLLKLRMELLKKIDFVDTQKPYDFAIRNDPVYRTKPAYKEFTSSYCALAAYVKSLCELCEEEMPKSGYQDQYEHYAEEMAIKMDNYSHWLFAVFCASNYSHENHEKYNWVLEKEKKLLILKMKAFSVGKLKFRSQIRKEIMDRSGEGISILLDDIDYIESEEGVKTKQFTKDFLTDCYEDDIPDILYKVPFHKAAHILPLRKSVLHKGSLWMETTDLAVFYLYDKLFKGITDKKKIQEMKSYAEVDPTDNVKKLVAYGQKVIADYATPQTTDKGTIKRKKIVLPDIEDCVGTSKSPLCMRILADKAKETKRLVNSERLQLTGYLRDIGYQEIPIYEYFKRFMDEKSFKDHFKGTAQRNPNYLSKRNHYTASCASYQNTSNWPIKEGLYAGCPFVYLNSQDFENALKMYGASEESIKKIATLRNLPTLACETFGGFKNNQTNNLNRRIYSPLDYWEKSN